MDIEKLVKWFEKNKRDLPWRKDTSPYRVWISEVMLQQTTTTAVAPYFEKWMKKFPNVKSLASAHLEEVIKQWEGLGYYSRARRLHSAAKKLVKDFNGEIPSSFSELQNIEGLGPYTIGALLSFAFKKRALAIDGNVVRVVTRLERIEFDISKAAAKKMINSFVEKHLPKSKPYVAMEAFIELGALICKKKPLCGLCPIRLNCKAFEKSDADRFPIKQKRKAQINLKRDVVIIEFQNSILLKKETNKAKVMADLYEFPYFDKVTSKDEFLRNFKKPIEFIKKLSVVTHFFTYHRVELFSKQYKATEKPNIQGYKWASKQEITKLPFSSGHKKVLLNLE